MNTVVQANFVISNIVVISMCASTFYSERCSDYYSHVQMWRCRDVSSQEFCHVESFSQLDTSCHTHSLCCWAYTEQIRGERGGSQHQISVVGGRSSTHTQILTSNTHKCTIPAPRHPTHSYFQLSQILLITHRANIVGATKTSVQGINALRAKHAVTLHQHHLVKEEDAAVAVEEQVLKAMQAALPTRRT